MSNAAGLASTRLVLALGVLVVLVLIQFGSRGAGDDAAAAAPLGASAARAPDISSMSPEERADRLFNRVMRLSSEGKADSAAFFASMAMGALESLAPLNAHGRYDLGLVALVTGDVSRATVQADTILAQHRSHLLGLSRTSGIHRPPCRHSRRGGAGAKALIGVLVNSVGAGVACVSSPAFHT